MKHVVPGRVPLRGLVMPESDEQIGEGLDGNVERGNRLVKRDENGMRDAARVAIAQLQVVLGSKAFGKLDSFTYHMGNDEKAIH